MIARKQNIIIIIQLPAASLKFHHYFSEDDSNRPYI